MRDIGSDDGTSSLPSGHHWWPVDDVLAHLQATLRPIHETCVIDLFESPHGAKILAEPLQARRSNPCQANSAVDGYGFCHASFPDRGPAPVVPGCAAAGAPFLKAVPAGAALHIFTGAVLPEGVDTVLLEENVKITPAGLEFNQKPEIGANTRQAGEDIKYGQDIFSQGHRLHAQDIALCVALGLKSVKIFRPLRIGVLSTGDELVRAGLPVLNHQSYDANGPMLVELIKKWGFEAFNLGRVGDDPEAVSKILNDSAKKFDAVITSGGASGGEEDYLGALLGAYGQKTIWRVAIKPGRPFAMGLWQGCPIFVLPGNPVAAFVCALLFAKPSFDFLSGGPFSSPQSFLLPAAFTKEKKAGRREYLRARIGKDGGVEIFSSEGSGRISGLSWAQGLVELGDDACCVSPGDFVRFLPFSSFALG